MDDLIIIAKARELLLSAGCAPERLLCPYLEEKDWWAAVVRFRNARDQRPREAAVHVFPIFIPIRNWVLWREPEDLAFDPQEEDPKLAHAFLEVDAVARRDTPWGRPFAHRLWEFKKRLLKERFGIDWKSPAEMNRNVLFD